MGPLHLLLAAAVSGLHLIPGVFAQKPPNIIVIMSDDQDYRLGSLDYMKIVQDQIVSKGVLLNKHFVTTAQCCPSRVAYHRGQAAHNTNNTHVSPAGGGYAKFVLSGEDNDYLPHWLKKAGYQTNYMGKLLNGMNLANYSPKPKGWDHIDILVDPYMYMFNNVVMSLNGERPVSYHGYHQTDVIRAKALDRLEYLTGQEDPFYFAIAPTSPHIEQGGMAVPLERHSNDFPDAIAPRLDNFNPADEYTQQKVSWLRNLLPMTDEQVETSDLLYKLRIQALQGLDEIVEDVLKLLEEKGALDNTYVIYTSDNGYHIGNHRVEAGKSLPYVEDTNIPMAVRGPGIPEGLVLQTPTSHLDMAPTFLDISGLSEGDWPDFLDGRSLLGEWKGEAETYSGSPKEILNIEFWGSANIELPVLEDQGETTRNDNNSYKTLRIMGKKTGWLFTRWCTGNETELYNIIDDPNELVNLAIDPTPEHAKVMSRLNGLLLVTKSCSGDSCRNPWTALQPSNGTISNLDEAMGAQHDAFFESLPGVGFQTCMTYQYPPNEIPFYPPESASLGSDYRDPTDNFGAPFPKIGTFILVPPNETPQGTAEQRDVTLEEIMKTARELTDREIGESEICYYPDYCGRAE